MYFGHIAGNLDCVDYLFHSRLSSLSSYLVRVSRALPQPGGQLAFNPEIDFAFSVTDLLGLQVQVLT